MMLTEQYVQFACTNNCMYHQSIVKLSHFLDVDVSHFIGELTGRIEISNSVMIQWTKLYQYECNGLSSIKLLFYVSL